ncbi:helix-turn-helix domain-containing protein [Streptomyces sp. FR-108]|uniref:helix-turn-helix domain-containing protein n=1 Tax=Streptomyces sp. FR-108 TaxID=3416665 RepID=UPI003CF91127
MTAATLPRPKVFSTEAAGPECVEAWEAHNAAQLIALSCDVPCDAEFEAAEVNLELTKAHLARVRGSQHKVIRTRDLIESDPAHAYAVYATLRGSATLEHSGHTRVLHPGQVMVCDADLPIARGFAHGLEELAIKVPRELIHTNTGLDLLAEPLIFDARSDGHARALVHMLGTALDAGIPVPPDEQGLVELVSVLAAGPRTSSALRHRVAARNYIAQRLHDPSLSAAGVAAAVGLSERTLSRVFAASGMSVPQQISGRRLDVAYALLRARPDFTTAAVAARCGFWSYGYFSQTFQRRFGVTAGEVRRLAHASSV